MHKVRSDRLVGWLPVRDLDLKAETAVVRMISDAQREGGLLRLALAQLQRNWTHEGGPRRSAASKLTWWGRALTMVRRTWPRFSVETTPRMAVTGTPTDCAVATLHLRFADDSWRRRWEKRRHSVLTSSPSSNSEEHLLAVLLRNSTATNTPLIPVLPDAHTQGPFGF